MVKTSVQCWVCMTNQQWNQKSLMSFNVLRTNWKKKKNTDILSFWAPSHIIKHLWWRLYIPFKVFGLNPTSLNIYGGDKCSMLTLHDKWTRHKSLQCPSMFYAHLKFLGSIPRHKTFMVKTSIQCWVCTTNQHWHQKSSLFFNVLRTI